METTGVGQFAVVTGASSGIGYELARDLINRGYDVLVAAENDIDAAAERLGGKATPFKTNLATFDGVEALCAKIRSLGKQVDLVCINAGVGVGGEFATQTKLEDELNLINLNVTSSVHLAKRMAETMVGQGEGRILLTSSIASAMPGPFYAVYAASKAFIQSFAEALREELKERNVVVTALMPGATDTNFFARANMIDTPVGQSESKDDPAEVAHQGIDAVLAGKDAVVTVGIKNKAQVAASKVMSQPAKAKMHRKQVEPNGRH
jgi:short-subunit dehydrogenase